MSKNICNFLINFFLSLFVFLYICIIIVSITIFNNRYIKNKLEENNFYDLTYFDIKKSFENYTMQSGLELDILENLITKERVINDINKKIDSFYDKKIIEIDNNFIIEELDKRINKILNEKNKILNDDEKKSITKYEEVIGDCYKNGILYGKDLKLENEIFQKISIFCIIGILILNIILIIINMNFLKNLIFWGINLLFSGILCIFIRLFIERKIQNILFFDAKFSKLLVNTLNEIILYFYKFGIISCIIGSWGIIVGIIFILKNKSKKSIVNDN